MANHALPRGDIAAAPRLLGDIGGTNARFAWQAGAGAPLQAQRIYPCAQYPSLRDAALQYLQDSGVPRPQLGCIGIANPVDGDAVRMTNHHWSFSINELQQQLGLQRLLVINDFKALALALPSLTDAVLTRIGGGDPDPRGVKALIGPGTGLGVSGLVPYGIDGAAGWIALDGEGGHTSASAHTPREWQVVQALTARHGHCSFERIVCGPGLVGLYQLLCEFDGAEADAALTAADIVQHAQAGTDAHCVEAVQLFLAFLGTAAGNLALTLGARGGVYLGGGILPRLRELLPASALRSRFEAKGRFEVWLRRVPLLLIDAAESPALQGAANALDGAG